MKGLKFFFLLLCTVLFFQSCTLLSTAGIGSKGQPIVQVEGKLTSTTANSAVNVDHQIWDALLKKHVDQKGLVSYKGFIKDESELDAYLNQLANLAPSKDWSVQELLAFYINLYNAETVKLILENYPTKSIKNINGAWIKGRARVDGKKLSLGGIENGVLRKMNEPRIHFAVNCASISCPKLLNEAYTAGKINEQLEQVTIDFINGDKNDINAMNPMISSIFKFYPDDFEINGNPNITKYINQYSTIKIENNAILQYKDYNWGLNEQ